MIDDVRTHLRVIASGTKIATFAMEDATFKKHFPDGKSAEAMSDSPSEV